MATVVPPRPHARLVIGRPKTRATLRLSGALATLGVMVAFCPTDEAPVLFFLGAAGVAGALAIVLCIFERPRQFTEYRPSPTLGLPVLHASAAPSVSADGSAPDRS